MSYSKLGRGTDDPTGVTSTIEPVMGARNGPSPGFSLAKAQPIGRSDKATTLAKGSVCFLLLGLSNARDRRESKTANRSTAICGWGPSINNLNWFNAAVQDGAGHCRTLQGGQDNCHVKEQVGPAAPCDCQAGINVV
jgi:hypothetical protein